MRIHFKLPATVVLFATIAVSGGSRAAVNGPLTVNVSPAAFTSSSTADALIMLTNQSANANGLAGSFTVVVSAGVGTVTAFDAAAYTDPPTASSFGTTFGVSRVAAGAVLISPSSTPL